MSVSGGGGILEGDSGNDTLYAWSGNYLLAGGVGDDFLYAAYGQITLEGGAGNDILQFDCIENATILWGRGDGNDTVTRSGALFNYQPEPSTLMLTGLGAQDVEITKSPMLTVTRETYADVIQESGYWESSWFYDPWYDTMYPDMYWVDTSSYAYQELINMRTTLQTDLDYGNLSVEDLYIYSTNEMLPVLANQSLWNVNIDQAMPYFGYYWMTPDENTYMQNFTESVTSITPSFSYVITIKDTGEHIDFSGVTLNRIEFADGTSVDNIPIAGNAQNDFLLGFADDDILQGREGNDQLLSGDGNDTLDGGIGIDILDGGLGNDTFTFNTELSTTNVDTINDFLQDADKIGLNAIIFTKLLGDTDLSDNLIVGTNGVSAQDADDYLIYNSSTNALYYDADGSDTGNAPIQFSTLANISTLHASDFVVL